MKPLARSLALAVTDAHPARPRGSGPQGQEAEMTNTEERRPAARPAHPGVEPRAQGRAKVKDAGREVRTTETPHLRPQAKSREPSMTMRPSAIARIPFLHLRGGGGGSRAEECGAEERRTKPGQDAVSVHGGAMGATEDAARRSFVRGAVRRATKCAALGFVLFAMGAATADAAYDPVASGQTTLTLAAPFLRELRSHGVRLSATAPATLKGASASFPVGAGRLDPVDAIGTAESEGALVFSAGRRKLPMKEPQLKTSRRSSPLAAKLGGGKLKLAASSKLTTERSGFGLAMKVSTIRLSAKVATRIEKKLGLHGAFTPNQLLGTAVSEAQPATVAIKAAGRAELTIDPAFAAKLASLFVATNPIFPAEHPGPFTFPVAGGNLAPDGSSGALATGGAIEFLQLGGGQVIMREPEVELGQAEALSVESELLPSPPYAGKLVRAPALGLAGGTLSSEPATRAIGLSGAGVSLTPTTAAQMNEAFAKPLGRPDTFAAGEALGTLTFAAQAE